MSYFVRINHLSNEELAGFGYYFAGEDDEFIVYQRGHDDLVVVRKSHPFLYVDDLNDAAHMRAPVVIKADRP